MAINQQRRSVRVCHTLLIILGICTWVARSGICDKEFVFAPMPNVRFDASIGVILQAVSDEDIHVNIFARGISLDVNLTLPSGSGPYDYPLPNSLIYRDVAGKINSTVVITSDNDIFVLAYNMYSLSSDVFSVIPKQYLGQEYFIATITWENYYSRGSGVISISASEHNAYVEISLNSAVEFENDWFYAGDIIRYNLLPYETIQLLPLFTNITGSRVIGNASLAVSVGSKATGVPSDVAFGDHTADQLAPFTAWGREFVVSPFTRRTSGYVLQIIAGRDNTTVSYGGVVTKLNMGHYVTVDIRYQEMLVVSADKPISVMQYSTGSQRDIVESGDPSMIRVIPVEQYVTMSQFPVYEFPPVSSGARDNYLGITSKCEYIANITTWMNGIPVMPLWIDHNTAENSHGTQYCSQWTSVKTGAYTLKSQPIITDDGREIYPRFSAVVYGTVPRESYSYRAASDDKTLTYSTSIASTEESSTESSIPAGISSRPTVSMTSSEPSTTEDGPISANTITSGTEPSPPKMSTASPPEETTDPPPPNTGLYVGIGIAAAIVVLVLLALTAYIIKLRHRLETAKPSDNTSPKDAHVNHAYEEPAKHVEQPYEEPKPNLNHEYDDIDDKRTYVEIDEYVNRPYAKHIVKDT